MEDDMDEKRLNSLIKKRLEETGLLKAPIFCDIDQTLIAWNLAGTKHQPNQQVLEALRFMHQSGQVEIVLWSGAGSQHCKEIAEELGITDIVSAYLTNPAFCIDDKEIKADFLKHIYPENI